jgi:cell wall-associated NlpC family hydrolase
VKATPPQTSPAFSNLIGVPYSKMNCWDLVKTFYKQVLDKDLKHYCEGDASDRSYVCGLIYTHQGDFKKVRSPQFGDILTLKIMGVESHIAVYVGNEQILHTTKTTGSIIDRLGRWSKLVVGYYTLDVQRKIND